MLPFYIIVAIRWQCFVRPGAVHRLLSRRPIPAGRNVRGLSADVPDEDPLNQLLGHAGTYHIGVGPQTGRKVFTL